MELRNSTFIVTGGASGLGAATVEMIVAGGGNAVIADIKGGEALAARLGRQAVFQPTDVTNEDQGKACVERAQKEFGGLQGLVNCAGIAVGEKTIGKEGPHALQCLRSAAGPLACTRLEAVLTTATCVNACGKLPT